MLKSSFNFTSLTDTNIVNSREERYLYQLNVSSASTAILLPRGDFLELCASDAYNASVCVCVCVCA